MDNLLKDHRCPISAVVSRCGSLVVAVVLGSSRAKRKTAFAHDKVNHPTSAKRRQKWGTLIIDMMSAGCRWSRGCTWVGAADWWSVVEATMGSVEVVVGGPGLEVLVAFVGVLPVFGVGPFAQGGLDKSFSFAVGSRCVGPGSVVFDIEAVAGGAELVGAVRASVVGEQSPHADSVAGVEVEGVAEKADGGFGLLVGQHLSKGEAGVVVDGDVQGLEAGVLMQASAAAIGAQQNLLITGKALDIEVQQIAWEGVFVSLHGGCRVQIAPSAEASALQNAAHGG